MFSLLLISYLYVLESKMYGDKGESEGIYYGLGTATVTTMMRGAKKLTVMKVTIISKMATMMTTKTMIFGRELVREQRCCS